jgi:hypothetical protein
VIDKALVAAVRRELKAAADPSRARDAGLHEIGDAVLRRRHAGAAGDLEEAVSPVRHPRRASIICQLGLSRRCLSAGVLDVLTSSAGVLKCQRAFLTALQHLCTSALDCSTAALQHSSTVSASVG